MSTEPTHPNRYAPLWLVVAAFAAIYVIWGATYLGIRYAVESIPPFLMAGSRNLVAGLILFTFSRSRGAAAPSRIEWKHAAICGALMLLIGNGGVTWAEQWIPSGITALLVALTPVWMVLFDWLSPRGTRPGARVILGLVVGFFGVAMLVRNHLHGSGQLYGWAMAVLMVSSIGWALGSVFNRSARKPASLILAGSMQLIAGGILLLVCGLASGEWRHFDPTQVTRASLLAWVFLVLAGSITAFTAFIWLLQVSTPARVGTNAYINPLIAVLLGCTIGHEAFSRELFVAGALIITAVALIVRGGKAAPVAKISEAAPQPEG